MNDFPELQQQYAPSHPKRHRRRWKWVVLILIILGIAGGVAFKYLTQANQIFTGDKNIFARIGNLLLSPDKELIGESNGQINILLMGIGGPGHEGALLTDTMLVANINIQTNEVVLTNIPRDFMVDLPKYRLQKINAAYAYAERDNPGTGGEAAIDEIEAVTGLEIPYYAVIDFKGFVKGVDDVGGLDITIDRTFTDAFYPDYKNGYLAPVTFTKGPEHMNGERALIFARSRKGNNNEGSDFARSERQKKILVAFKEKVFALKLNDLKTLNNLLGAFTDNFRTNMEPHELKRLTDLGSKIQEQSVYSFSLEPDGELVCSALIDLATGKPPVPIAVPPTPTPPPAGGPTPTPSPSPSPTPTPEEEPELDNPSTTAYVVIPCVGKTLADIHTHLKDSIYFAKLKKESAIVEIQNSTGKTGLANSLFGTLTNLGFEIKFTSFTGKVPLEQSIIYDNSHGGKPNTLEYLNSNYKLTISDVNYTGSTADFVIILGKDAL
ncbi:MAG: hypothetical protein A3I07_00380 [Candidatus Doudnabacteria bacterium RIFCSPLOWO2_02_FULL_42_9]|uniref:Cell envelope-related transcriptional attenuator domain-containing protein n=1 Tax=Candidatus Doudnabacteria bacterium RIFCSPHIGHO2_01_FULL_41_86 TaxID=1817821 RepID=A0A1F5NA02_9BACT|nr:MAG: hypothetical protein A2717_02575 [Candidatus Doudnabacteria bacterium RIFCSPHIGHO2_01_FULL_41_86]OGE75480.1 MAG: hypothetical protein A3K07_00905 [Candidatus Doudnabacteria bacterium RIFCSPHIGHO2_01_43_10]OGE85437.1 MAG: hypothetical protein A3E28_02145 [Candidatus Doudnabacteria bacterium RIFCSPHIGHO2_12_FULL_42_22]OGE86975.1 MAG: hypothetical protein A3C49_02980 [Candidatus Doudnabacteria bacterium RIFCSPHIGHO2_02_FULL_42_25]OGE92574.1 MAG: hypothetical protein A2895_03135 [Candidatus